MNMNDPDARPLPPPMQQQRVYPANRAPPGPLDWLVPFIPPFLRVNRETRAAFVASLQTLSVAAIATQLTAFLQRHARSLLRYGLLLGAWIYGLAWTDRAAPEFTGAYVIVSGLSALALHLCSGDVARSPDGLSAYSVFNKGGARILGSLSAEQFENEIRHRQPDHHIANYDDDDERRLDDEHASPNGSDGNDEDDANDPDLLLALELSRQEHKREARRARRTTKRR